MPTTATFTVLGMTCDHCAAAVTAEVGRLPGVSDVHVDLDTGAVTVTSAQPLDRDQVAAAVDEAGYDLSPDAPASGPGVGTPDPTRDDGAPASAP